MRSKNRAILKPVRAIQTSDPPDQGSPDRTPPPGRHFQVASSDSQFDHRARKSQQGQFLAVFSENSSHLEPVRAPFTPPHTLCSTKLARPPPLNDQAVPLGRRDRGLVQTIRTPLCVLGPLTHSDFRPRTAFLVQSLIENPKKSSGLAVRFLGFQGGDAYF